MNLKHLLTLTFLYHVGTGGVLAGMDGALSQAVKDAINGTGVLAVLEVDDTNIPASIMITIESTDCMVVPLVQPIEVIACRTNIPGAI